MKKQIDLQLLATMFGGILINYLFWMEGTGLNLMVYSLFMLLIISRDNEVLKNRNMLLAGAAHFLAAITVVINHSDLTITSWFVTLAVFVGLTHFPSLRSVPGAIMGALLQLATVPLNIARKIKIRSYVNFSFLPFLRPIKYIVIPFIALVLFSTLYSIANPVIAIYFHNFAEYGVAIFTSVFNFFFTELSFLRFLHVLLGIFLSAAVFISYGSKRLESIEAMYGDDLRRERKKKKYLTLAYEIVEVFAGDLLKRKMALKTENIIGILSFSTLNLLILLLNILDFRDLLKENTVANQLSTELHGGTYALIISVMLAMMIILYFFSGNLNFYSKNRSIRILAYIWIAQNFVLVLFVLFRDLQYIGTFGLTYKRIGVLVFLLLCTIGLTTVYIKVAQRKTLFYLCRVNVLIWYLLLLSFGFVNWDICIVNYNITNRQSIDLDVRHLMSMSDDTLPVLHKNKELLTSYMSTTTQQTEVPAEKFNFEGDLGRRIRSFQSKYENSSWLSLDYRDWKTYHYFSNQQL